MWRGAEKRQAAQELPAADPLVDRVEEEGT
jgi:hypothetical protein